MLPLGLRTAWPVQEQYRRQPDLAGQVVDDLDWRVPAAVAEAALGAHDAGLQCNAATVVGAAALGDNGAVRGRQIPVLREFSLARINRDWQSALDLRVSAWGSSVDIEMRALQVGSEVVA